MVLIFLSIFLLHAFFHFLPYAGRGGNGMAARIAGGYTLTESRLWLSAGLMLTLSSALLLFQFKYWWALAAPSLAFSQILVFRCWKKARYITLLNLVMGIGCSIAVFTWYFRQQFEQDTHYLLRESSGEEILLTESDIARLPIAIQKYIRVTGSLNKARIRNFHVAFEGFIRAGNDAPWMPMNTIQFNSTGKVSRFFFMNAVMFSLPVAGYHRFDGQKATMDIRVLSMLPVQFADGPEMDISETVTYFNDLCLMAPAALIDGRIKWLSESKGMVRAQFTNGNIVVTADLHFDDQGRLVNFVSEDRYAMRKNGKMERNRWSTPVTEYRNFGAYNLPARAEVVYHYPEGDLTYGKFSAKNIEYNLSEDH